MSQAARALAADFLDEVRLRLKSDRELAREIREALAIEPGRYTQLDLPPGMSKRGYLRHCLRRDWPSFRQGRLRVTLRSEYEAWLATRRQAQREAIAAAALTTEDMEAFAEQIGAKAAALGRKRRA